MQLYSPAFQNGEVIPAKYTCDGPNISPPLSIKDVPAAAKSLVLIMEDPDVPRHLRKDGMWNHWLIFNIPPTTQEIKENEEPVGTHGLGTSNNLTYYGPCPPDREHRYFFKLYALDTKLMLPEKSTKTEIEHAMQKHVLAQTELIGHYARKEK